MFFPSSLPRLPILKELQESQFESTVDDTLKRLSDTRMSCWKHAVDAVVNLFTAILTTLENINLGELKEHKGKD